MNRDLFESIGWGCCPSVYWAGPGRAMTNRAGMGYRTSGKHALNGPSTALLLFPSQSRSLPMPASRDASAAGKRAETMAAVMALTRLITAAESGPAQQASERAPAAWRGGGGGGRQNVGCRGCPPGLPPQTPPMG